MFFVRRFKPGRLRKELHVAIGKLSASFNLEVASDKGVSTMNVITHTYTLVGCVMELFSDICDIICLPPAPPPPRDLET